MVPDTSAASPASAQSVAPPSQPLVSVCIPLLNQADTIDRALNSATSQIYPNVEIVVLDIASTDGSAEIIAGWTSRDPRVKWVHLDHPVDEASALRYCVSISTGEFCRFLGADGLMHSQCIALTLPPLLERPEVGYVACRTGPLFDHPPDEEARTTFESLHMRQAELVQQIAATTDCAARARIIALLTSASHSLGPLCAPLFRRQCVQDLNCASGRKLHGAPADWDFLLRLYAGSQGLYVDRLLAYAMHSPAAAQRKARARLQSDIYEAIEQLHRPLTLLTDPALHTFRDALPHEQTTSLVDTINREFESLFALVQRHDASAALPAG